MHRLCIRTKSDIATGHLSRVLWPPLHSNDSAENNKEIHKKMKYIENTQAIHAYQQPVHACIDDFFDIANIVCATLHQHRPARMSGQ